jgi:hypothetical protein
MKTNWLSKIIRHPAMPALAIVLAMVTASSAATTRKNSTAMKRAHVRLEYAVPQNAQQDQGWYQPPRSPNFSAYLH